MPTWHLSMSKQGIRAATVKADHPKEAGLNHLDKLCQRGFTRVG